MSQVEPFALSALLLAGGQGSRLGGRDKGLMPWQGEPIAAHLVTLLRQVSSEVLISCNRNHEQYRTFADVVVSDREEGFPGPLAGILSGLARCRGSHLLILPCDLPHLDVALLDQLVEKASGEPARPWLVRTGERWQPLVSIIPVKQSEDLERFWNEGHRSPMRWFMSRDCGVMDLAEDDPRLHNANRPEDWPQA